MRHLKKDKRAVLYDMLLKGGKMYAQNGTQLPLDQNDPPAAFERPMATADFLKTPDVQSAINQFLSRSEGRVRDLREQRSKLTKSDGSLRAQLNQMMNFPEARLESASYGDVDALREKIAMTPTTREERQLRDEAVAFASAVSDAFALQSGQPFKNPLYNLFGITEDDVRESIERVNRDNTIGTPKYNEPGKNARLLYSTAQ